MTIAVDFQPVGRNISVEAGVTVLEASRAAGVGLSAVCGGETGCGSCRVRLSSDAAVSPPNSMERDILSVEELAQGLRLACQTRIRGSLRVDIPPESLTAPQRTQVEGEELPFELDPPVTAHTVQLKEATQTDQRSDWERLSDALVTAGKVKPRGYPLGMVRQLPGILRENDWQVQMGLRGEEIVSVSAPDSPLLGLAIDIGTTKIAGYLVDLKSGQTLAMQGIMNPQIGHGEDIMARIAFVMKQPAGDRQLQKAVVDALNQLALDLCRQASMGNGNHADAGGVTPLQIAEVVVVGNTAMHHLFLGLPVRQLGMAPYIAAASAAMDVKANEIGLSVSDGAVVHLLPLIAGFVGGDHVSMLLATDISSDTGNCIYLDIGTNTEVTLTTGGRTLSCSTASGPAFEGAHIKDGMRAAEGAIERVRIVNNRIVVQTINDEKPVGICGSGILDAIAQFKLAGVMNPRGAFEAGHPLVREGERGLEVVLVAGVETKHGRDIVLTRKDVSEIQLAKGAIRAGIELLLLEAGLSADRLEQVIIAGAFGSFIDVNSAIAIGMFPLLPRCCFRQVGNAAGIGAKMALLSLSKRGEAQEIARKNEYLELSNHGEFTNEFTRAMRF
ncbi:DUF4445 domain-containing protein [bacterium]|nr:DUF4445 domain-containing protein [bacterium]